ncbi:uncharacterized protein [Macaca fascicularis]|uniref:uncharacterized protein n=1 Tax=Macaca fascicularis TaxID=9541 RepID=UPI0032B067A5
MWEPPRATNCSTSATKRCPQILPSPVLARPEDGLFLRCSPQCKDEDDDDGDVDCDDDDDVQIRAWKGNDLTLESISDKETHPGLGRGPEDMRLMHRSKRRFSPSLMHTKVVGCSPCPWRCAADRCSSRGLAS